MNIAILSGKGGTGKTLVSVNLAAVSDNSIYVDCDVEEPNGHLFFKPLISDTIQVDVLVPEINNELCNGCRKCVSFCKFNALAFINHKVKLFDEICHSCGGCAYVCPTNAITETKKKIGDISVGKSKNTKVITGMLKIGEQSGVPIINKELELIKNDNKNIFIDCPPGSSCVVMESIKDADYCVLVAEPTIFGSHNLNMVYNLVKIFNKKVGVVLNKCNNEFNPSENFCIKNNIKILSKIPFETTLGQLNSEGKIAVNENASYKKIFNDLLKKITKEVNV